MYLLACVRWWCMTPWGNMTAVYWNEADIPRYKYDATPSGLNSSYSVICIWTLAIAPCRPLQHACVFVKRIWHTAVPYVPNPIISAPQNWPYLPFIPTWIPWTDFSITSVMCNIFRMRSAAIITGNVFPTNLQRRLAKLTCFEIP